MRSATKAEQYAAGVLAIRCTACKQCDMHKGGEITETVDDRYIVFRDGSVYDCHTGKTLPFAVQ